MSCFWEDFLSLLSGIIEYLVMFVIRISSRIGKEKFWSGSVRFRTSFVSMFEKESRDLAAEVSFLSEKWMFTKLSESFSSSLSSEPSSLKELFEEALWLVERVLLTLLKLLAETEWVSCEL